MRRGAFFNEECLFLDRPVSYSSVADEDSVVWAIDRVNMKDLEAHDPFLAAEILRNVLRVSSMARMRLEREVSALETSTLEVGKKTGTGLGQSILAEISTPKSNGKDLHAEPRLSHQFGRIIVDRLSQQSSETAELKINNFEEHRPHLSRPMRKDAMDCFLYHSATAGEHTPQAQGKRGLGTASFFSSANNRKFIDPFDQNQNADGGINMDRRSLSSKLDKRRIKINELQKAVMDLGFFPTIEEIQKMHETLGPTSMQRISSSEHEHGVDIQEFIKIIEVLSFSEITQQQRSLLYNLFKKYCDNDYHLSREGLASLMQELGHPENELELEMLMHEWDCNQQGYLDFSDFISIVAQVVKTEELDAKVEHDFLTVCGKRVDEIANNRRDLLKSTNTHITAEDLIRVSREQRKSLEPGLSINPEIAEEMIFDSSETNGRMVSLNELITTIETVYRDESVPSKKEESVPSKKVNRITQQDSIPGVDL